MASEFIYQVVVTRKGKYLTKWGTKSMVINTLWSNATLDRSKRAYNSHHKFANITVMRVPLAAFEDVTHEFLGDDAE